MGTSGGTLSKPCAQYIRLTEQENRRLRRLVRKRGLTIQAFCHAAVMKALDEAEGGKETDIERERRFAASSEFEREKEAKRTRGMGIRERLLEEDLDREEKRYRSESRQKVTNTISVPSFPVGQTYVSPSPSSDVTSLARTIVGLPTSSRRDALESAVRSLAHGRTQEEALRLAEDLDREIKRLNGAGQTVLEKVRARMKK